jgi:hypothetical protein
MNITDMKSLPSEKAIAINLTTIGAADLFLKLPKYFIDEIQFPFCGLNNQSKEITPLAGRIYVIILDLASKETFV